jgi:hypothetical protein
MTARGTTLLLSLAAALGLAGCGGSAGTSSQGTQAVPPAGKPAGSASVTAVHVAGSPHTQFVAFAHDVNLRPQDLAGFVAQPKHSGEGSDLTRGLPDKAKYERCLGAGKEAKPLFKSSSATFQARNGTFGFLSAKSQVQVIPTRATAEKELTTTLHQLRSPAKLRCFTSAIDAMLGGSHTAHTDGHTVQIKIGNVRAAPVQLGAPAGTHGGYGLSVSVPVTYAVTVRGREVSVPETLSIDWLNFVLGRAGVGLTTMAFGAPFPSAREASLFSTLVTRAVQAGHHAPAVSE